MNKQIFALHGFTGVGSDFAPFAKLFDATTWHCPNLPGHGPSPQLDCKPEATLDFIQSQVSDLRFQPSAPQFQVSALSPQPSALLGYSMGARAALLHAMQFPKQWNALILISPSPGIEHEAERAERRRVDAKLSRRIEKEGVSAFIEFWQSTPMIRSQKNIRKDWREAMQASRRQHTAGGLANSLRQFGQGHCPNLWPELEKLTLPTLLLSGTEDRKYTDLARRMAELLPNARHDPIEGSGHMPHLEAPEASAHSITRFLSHIA